MDALSAARCRLPMLPAPMSAIDTGLVGVALFGLCEDVGKDTDYGSDGGLSGCLSGGLGDYADNHGLKTTHRLIITAP